MKISLPEEMQNVQINEKWGQEIFIDGLAEYIRGFIKHAVEQAIKQELTNFLGYEHYQRGEEKRDNNRNGFYERDLLTRYGLIEDIQVARNRKGEFESRVLPHYQRREEKIDRQIIDLFIGGISTRKMKKITKELIGRGYSSGTISRINKQLTQEMRAWLEQPIEDNIVYIFLDGLNLTVKRFTVSKESLLVAIGITADGYRKILGGAARGPGKRLLLAGVLQGPKKAGFKRRKPPARDYGRPAGFRAGLHRSFSESKSTKVCCA